MSDEVLCNLYYLVSLQFLSMPQLPQVYFRLASGFAIVASAIDTGCDKVCKT